MVGRHLRTEPGILRLIVIFARIGLVIPRLRRQTLAKDLSKPTTPVVRLSLGIVSHPPIIPQTSPQASGAVSPDRDAG